MEKVIFCESWSDTDTLNTDVDTATFSDTGKEAASGRLFISTGSLISIEGNIKYM